MYSPRRGQSESLRVYAIKGMYSPKRRKASCSVGSVWARSVSCSDGRSAVLPCSLLIQVVQLVEIFDNDNDNDDDNDGDDDDDNDDDDKTV